ncbi:MAG: radical SAM/SPASM domain-containing protein [Ruminiclostridium sp.]
MKAENIPVDVIYSELITQNGKYLDWEKLKTEEYNIYRKKWKENPINDIVEPFPLNLDIEPTNHCNLKCPFCYRTIAIDSGNAQFDNLGLMPIETFKRILNQITVNGKCMVPAIKLTHRGEPLINRNIATMVRMAKTAGVEDVIMNTNGTLLTPELSEELLDAGLDKMLFSFDSPHKDTYESIRIGASYEIVLNNIRMFVDLRNKKKAYGTMVRVGMVITEETVPYVDDFKSLFENIADVISFNKVHKEVEIDDEGNFINDKGEMFNVQKRIFADSQLWQRMTINWNGDAEICCENYKQEYSLGNINDITVREIWNGSRFGAVRELHRNGEWWKMPQCIKCTIPFME